MEQRELRGMLVGVAMGMVAVDDGMLRIGQEPFDDLGFAKLDHHRAVRQG